GGVALRRTALADAGREAAEALIDGPLFRLRDGVIVDLTPEAEALQGAARGLRLDAVLADLLEDGREEAISALDSLERTGRTMRLLVTDRKGRPWELSGRPRGGELIVTLRDASLSVTELRKSEARISLRERALEAGWYERRAILNMLTTGSAIAWHRGRDGQMTWSSGCVKTRHGNVSAQETVALIRARPGDTAADENGVVRSRIEILPAGAIEPLPLHVIEVFAADGTATGLAMDATVAAQAERTLSRFVQTMTETFAHLTAGLAIFDRNQKLVLFNPAFAQMLQLDPAWLANRPSLRDALDMLRTKRRIPETGDFHSWRARLLSLFENPERVDFDEVWHLADGTNIKVLARPHPHGSLAFVFDDISDRVRLEQRYRQSIDLQEATLNRLDEALAVFGTDGRLQLVNDAFHEIFRTDPSMMRPGTHAREVMALCSGLTVEAELWTQVAAFITAADARQPFTEGVTLGSSRRLRVRVAALPGGGTMLVAADVTDSERIAEALRDRNEALEAAEEMRTAVLDQISHRLRTPLNTIFGFGQLLSDARFGQLSERQGEYAGGILEASGQLLDTIDEVTNLAALRPGARPEDDAVPPLAETLELTRALLQKRAAEAGVALSVDLPDEALLPACPPAHLRQALFSMTAGAILRAGRGGAVSLAAERREGAIAIDVFETRAAPIGPEDGASEGAFQGASVGASGGVSGGATTGAGSDAAPTDPDPGSTALALSRRLVEGVGGFFLSSKALEAVPEPLEPTETAEGADRQAALTGRTTAVFPERAVTPDASSEPDAGVLDDGEASVGDAEPARSVKTAPSGSAGPAPAQRGAASRRD
ncbi:MAG: PAS-domain containing protein, partial [Pseudomonadota bacterium]